MGDRKGTALEGRSGRLLTAGAVAAGIAWKAAQPWARETTPFAIALPAFFALAIALAPPPSNRPGAIAKWILLPLMMAAAFLEQPMVCAPAAIFLFHYFSTLYSETSLLPVPENAAAAVPGETRSAPGSSKLPA